MPLVVALMIPKFVTIVEHWYISLGLIFVCFSSFAWYYLESH